MHIQPRNRFRRIQHHRLLQFCVPLVAHKESSCRLKDTGTDTLPYRPGRQLGTMTTTMWRTLRPLPPAHLWTVVNSRVDPVLRRAGGRGPLMPGVASGTAGVVGATDSATVAPVDMPELTSVPRLLGS
jgi:hypothetical protein